MHRPLPDRESRQRPGFRSGTDVRLSQAVVDVSGPPAMSKSWIFQGRKVGHLYSELRYMDVDGINNSIQNKEPAREICRPRAMLDRH